jgi:hypothetical protein
VARNVWARLSASRSDDDPRTDPGIAGHQADRRGPDQPLRSGDTQTDPRKRILCLLTTFKECRRHLRVQVRRPYQ